MAKKKRPQELHPGVLFLDGKSQPQLIRQLRSQEKPLIELGKLGRRSKIGKYFVGIDSSEGFSKPKTFKPELFRKIIKIFYSRMATKYRKDYSICEYIPSYTSNEYKLLEDSIWTANQLALLFEQPEIYKNIIDHDPTLNNTFQPSMLKVDQCQIS
ncbi:hypothetical protein ACP6PL_10040 [Dapis sp. BLCC M126]|uniref:hypothetical protein n=1 Tax=Dapis sp. BLCC M126 TaxID=3400189 RepID=UPI003CEACC2D